MSEADWRALAMRAVCYAVLFEVAGPLIGWLAFLLACSGALLPVVVLLVFWTLPFAWFLVGLSPVVAGIGVALVSFRVQTRSKLYLAAGAIGAAATLLTPPITGGWPLIVSIHHFGIAMLWYPGLGAVAALACTWITRRRFTWDWLPTARRRRREQAQRRRAERLDRERELRSQAS